MSEITHLGRASQRHPPAVYGQVSTASQAGVVGRQQAASGNWASYGFGNIGASGTKSAVVPAEDGNGI